MVLAALVAVALLILVNRPRLVTAEGLSGTPMGAWRLTGWRRSRELARRIADAIRAGRFDATGVLTTPTPGIPDTEPPRAAR